MKRWLLFLIIFALSPFVSAFEIVLPVEKEVVQAGDYAFFMGKANNLESITINNSRIYIAPNGAFAHSVKLKDGENRIAVRSSYNTRIYKFYKTPKPSEKEEPVVEFNGFKYGVIKKDNIPLFNSPSYSEIKRLGQLFKGTKVVIDAYKGDFYRVFLSKDECGWIPKQGVEFCDSRAGANPPVFINMNNTKYKNASVHTISFSDNLPYSLEDREEEILFKVYNPELSENSVYTMNIPKPEKYTYQINLTEGNYTFKINEIPNSISDCTIVIDAGHGGDEKGAPGPLGDEEKNINLKIALELQSVLRQLGANVVMTRECDGKISIEDRVAIAKNNNANIFVSIHLNSIGNSPMNIRNTRGTSVYYYNANSEKLAKNVIELTTKIAKTRNDRVRKGNYGVIRPACYAGILVEAAYMTNPMDSMLYQKADFAHNVAEGIAQGILKFISN